MQNKSKLWTMIFAIALIVLDATNIITIAAAGSAAAVFDLVMRLFFPCGILVGTAVLLHTFDRKGKKAVAGVSIAVSAFYLLMHIFALCLELSESGFSAVFADSGELLAYIEFIGYIVLLAANILLMVYVLCGKLRIATLSVFCVSGVLLLGGWVAILVGYLRAFSLNGTADISGFITTYIDWGFIYAVLSLIVYALVYFMALRLLGDRKIRHKAGDKEITHG